MTPRAYYNENNPQAAAWLRELIACDLIAHGDVDERSIADVSAGDIAGYRQCHWFGGIGGWTYALRLAGWPDTREVWTGSCPCQRLSSATRGRAVAADLWPEFRRLIADAKPRVVFGEQVANRAWFDGVCADMEGMGYDTGAAVLPAVAVGLDHARPRLYFASHAHGNGKSGVPLNAEMDWLSWRDREPGGMGTAHGLSRDMVALSGFGNAIVPQVAAEFIAAYMDITEGVAA